MRILHVVTLIDDQSSYGGPLTVAVNQCTELRRHGHDARILAGWIGTGRPPAELEGVPAHLFPVRNLTPGMRFSGLFSPAIAAWLRRHARSIDIAHVHLARDLVPLVASQILRRTGVPYVTQTHGMVAPDPRPQARMADRLLTLRVLRAASARFVLTPQEQNALAGLIGAAHRTELLPNGVTIPRRGSVEETPLDVLFMARLHPRKRVIDFAHAAAKLIEEGHDAIFSVVGPDDGDLQELLRFIDARSFISGRLRYEGALPHDRALERLSKASIYVLPSVDEPFPMTLLEALALGKPSICTNSCGIAADLQADGAALISDPGPNGLARHLRSLIDSAERRAELGDLAVKVAQGRFSMESVVAELLVRYEKAVVGAGTRRPLLWVTNIPTPYRAALWKELARREPLVVAPLAETEPNRHWQVDLDRPSYDFAPLRARPLARLGETTIYLPSRRLLKLIERRPRAVVLDGWESPAYLAAAFWARLRGVPVLASYRSTLASHRFSRGVVPFVRNWFFRRADAVITAGPASTEAVMAMGVPGDRITEGFNTVDVKRYARGAADARAGVLRRPGHHFLYVGQLIPRKNVAGLIRAFATIANPDDTLAIVGTGPLEGELRELAQSLSLFNAIRFEGHLDGDELIAAYATADTFVLPSTEEVWGLVVNEALAAGLHAVVSRNAGIVPSILGMPGVFPSKPDQESLSINLKVSRDRWVGHLIDPPILANTPGQLAKVILGALEQRIGISC